MNRHFRFTLAFLALLTFSAKDIVALILSGDAYSMLDGGPVATAAPPSSGGSFSLITTAGASSGGSSMSGGAFSVAPGVLTLPSAAADIGTGHAYPNPYRPASGHTRITFTDLTSQATIRIFTMDGRPVKTLHKNDTTPDLDWSPVTNASGQKVASGLYLFFIEDPATGQKKHGKLLIIR